jgi:hypothetical protein
MNPLDEIMGVIEGSETWELHPDHIKKLCERGVVEARKIGKTWILAKDQPNPRQRERRGYDGGR